MEEFSYAMAEAAKNYATEHGLGPAEGIQALITAGAATAFAYAQDGADLSKVSEVVVGTAKAVSENIIRMMKREEASGHC